MLKKGHIAAAQLLVDAGADAMCVGDDGTTPLSLATTAARDARALAASLAAAATNTDAGAGDSGAAQLTRSVTISTEAAVALARHEQAAVLLRSMTSWQ